MKALPATTGVLAVSLMLGGCAVGQRNFSCDGLPEGITCMSAVDVYNSTHGDEVAVKTDKPQNEEAAVETRTVTLGGITPPPDRPVPVRTDPEILRVLVYPWEDEAGYLNVGGYVFAEVTPRRWAVGDVPHASTRVLHSVNDHTVSVVPATALQEPAQAQQPARASNTTTGADSASGASNR